MSTMTPFPFTGAQIPTGVLDFSHLLDAPAGKHGFVKSKDGHFIFDNGKQIKFFGVNLVFGAAMPKHEVADVMVQRLANNGVNMVRFHHVDAMGMGNASLIDYSDGTSQNLQKESWDRFDYLVSKLKEKGIYIHIDSNTLRKYTKEDKLDFPDDVPPGVKTVSYYNKRIIKLHRDFMQKYLQHTNPYTGTRYVDDPSVAIFQICNENSIFWYNEWEMPPSYEKELNEIWNEWLCKKFGTREKLDAAWTAADDRKALAPDEDPAAGTVKGPVRGIWGEWTVGSHDPYEEYKSPARNAESLNFFTEMSEEYYYDTEKFLRELGLKCVLNLTNLPANIAELYAIAQGEVVENNGYWNHPEGGFRVPVKFHEGESVSLDPRKNHRLPFSNNLVSKFASSKVRDKPLVVTEWNVCYPTKFRGDAMLNLATYGAYQNWDGIILFSYSHQSDDAHLTRDRVSGFFDSYTDPAMWGMAGIASAIFQGKSISPPKTQVEVAYTDADRTAPIWHNSAYYNNLPFMTGVSVKFIKDKYEGDADLVISGLNTATGDYTAAKNALVFTINPYTDNFLTTLGRDEYHARHAGKANVKVWEDTEAFKDDNSLLTAVLDSCLKDFGLIDKERGFTGTGFVNDTGEIKYDFTNGIFAINTSDVKAICGNVKGTQEFGDFKTEIENEKAAIVAISRDGQPIENSNKILLAVIGNSSNSDMKWEGNTLVDAGGGPTLIERIHGKVYISSAKAACKGYAICNEGKRVEELAVAKTDSGYCIDISSKADVIYFEVELA